MFPLAHGRPPIPSRTILSGIVYRLRTGAVESIACAVRVGIDVPRAIPGMERLRVRSDE
jgi:hypothetical protein